jgi:GDP-mannose pyrophosphatase NudK
MAAIQILNKQTLSNNKYLLKLIKFEKPDKDGVFHNQEREVYFRPDAVGVLLVDEKQKKLLLTRQFRLPAFLNGSDSGYLVETCAGLIDETETPEQTARREVEEETGYQITDLEKIAGAYTSAGGITEYVHLFIAPYQSEPNHAKTGGLEGEDIELVEMSFDEAKEKLKQGGFRDMKTIILLQHFFMKW